MSKGSARRPGKGYADNHDRIFTPLEKLARSDVGEPKRDSIPNKISDNLDKIDHIPESDHEK